METLISDIIDVPERVRKGDFVLNLSKGVTEPDAHELGLTLEEIRNWQPPAATRKTRTPRKKTTEAEDDE